MGQIKLTALLVVAGCLPLAAQQENWCTDHNWHADGLVSHSEVREQMLAAGTENVVDPAMNGSIRVHAWANADIQVKACVQAAAADIVTAEALAKQVTVTDGAGRVVAKGPETTDHSWWSVSYEIWVPTAASLELKANNGSIRVEGTRGQIRAHTLNGSVTLKDVGGDVEGETTNGSLTVDVAAGSAWNGKGLRLKTVNGSIHLQLPGSFGAEVEASTVNGSLKSDFSTNQDPKERHNVRFTIGAGGPKIEAETVNGSVKISRQG
jgi:DUF4097 and DUF4098 domain-containing protein YvlB